MRTFLFSIIPLLGITSTIQLRALSQEVQEQPERPVVLETTFAKPRVEVLETTDEPNRRFERWREKVLVVFGSIPPSSDGRDFVSKPLVTPSFDLRLQTHEKKEEFSTRFTELKKELGTVANTTPQLKEWDLTQWTSKGEDTFPQQKFHSTPQAGWVCYAWLEREFNMESVRAGDKTMFKAQITTKAQGPTYMALIHGRTFNTETGEVVEQSLSD
jgi:hypothetical protein